MRMISQASSRISLSRAIRMVERGGDSGERSMAEAPCPRFGRQVRRAAMTDIQKRLGSLSRSSRESQATTGLAPFCSISPLAPRRSLDDEESAVHAESRVVLPLPAEAETSVKG